MDSRRRPRRAARPTRCTAWPPIRSPAAAVARVFAAKGRAAERALPLIAADAAQVAAHLGRLPPAGQRLADRFWPGPLTLLMPRRARWRPTSPAAPDASACACRPTSSRARFARRRGGRSPRPAPTSAARRRHADPDQVERTLGDRLDLLIDAGTTPGGAPSTIVDVTGADPALVRAGAISWDEIQAWLHSALAHPPAR